MKRHVIQHCLVIPISKLVYFVGFNRYIFVLHPRNFLSRKTPATELRVTFSFYQPCESPLNQDTHIDFCSGPLRIKERNFLSRKTPAIRYG